MIPVPEPPRGAAQRGLATVLSEKISSVPVLICPTGLAGLFSPGGERCAVRAVAGMAYGLNHGLQLAVAMADAQRGQSKPGRFPATGSKNLLPSNHGSRLD